MEEINSLILENTNKVLIFTNKNCPFCMEAIDSFRNLGVDPVIEIVGDETKIEAMEALHQLCNGNKILPR